MENGLKEYTYGAMSSKFSVMASDKLVAYAAMVYHYDRQAHLLVIYSPEECKEDRWASFDGKISDRLDEIFGGDFDGYVMEHIEEIKEAFKTIKRLV
jgi:hypothetical protein